MAEDIVLPDELPTVADTKRGAEWATMFPNATNLAQRARRNAELSNYADALQREQAAIMQNRLETNKGAQDFYFRQKKLEMDNRLGESQLAERQQRMEHEEAIFPERLAARDATTRATLARERAIINADKLKAELATQEATDTDGFQQQLMKARSSGVRVGTPEWEQSLIEARIANPAANTAIFDDLWKSTTRSRVDPEEAVRVYQAARNALPNTAAVSVSPSGGVTIKDSNQLDKLNTRLTRMRGLRAKTTEPDSIKAMDEDIKETEEEIASLKTNAPAQPAVNTDTPGPDISPEAHAALKSGDKFWWKGKQLTKQ